MRTQLTNRNSKPDLRSADSLKHLAKINEYLTSNYGSEVAEKAYRITRRN